ncbi:MAG: methyltransferase domain-containing protein [Armatimonadetes bacterium]|nr:methyltransferase domain-containing protein [Armatimonadota bacterium]
MAEDPFSGFKAAQRESWGLFLPVETFTTPPAAVLVRHAGIQAGDRVLDVGCGTGVATLSAAARGAIAKGLDLSPALLERARDNAELAGLAIEFTEGDVENLPYRDAEFDVVTSQFGHMFAPRPERAVSEMLRVLRPGGTLAFSTWPPEMFMGRMFALVGRYAPPVEGAAPPLLWGRPDTILERLGDHVKDVVFERGLALTPALSPQHFRIFMESSAAPLVKVVESTKDDPARLAGFRAELDSLISLYLHDNQLHQHFLCTRATKV